MRLGNEVRMMATAAIVALLTLPAMAQTPPLTAEATPFVGEWALGLDTPQGSMTMDLSVKNDAGKLAASLTSPMMMGAQAVNDIAVTGKNLVMQYSFDYQGQAIPAAITIMPDGDKWKASFDFAGGQFVVDGTATRK